MSEHQVFEDLEVGQYDNEKKKRREMSRRQFLSYTLGGSGAFMAAGMLVPMLRFAVDPILQPKKKGEWIKVVEESKITETPQSFDFTIHQIDGWYESDPKLTAWIAKEKGEIYALSPVCKHLGCSIDWNTTNQNQFVCPCHGAHYTKLGKNINIAPEPLDQYEVKVENGFVYLGELHANKLVTAK